MESIYQEKKVKVRDWELHCVLSGHGPKYIVCISGGIGFAMQNKLFMEVIDKDKFTLIAWDKHGFAKSRPPNRVLDENLFEEDADFAYELMKALNIPRYSILGYCGGGRVAMFVAAKHPDQVENLILMACSSFVHPQEWAWAMNPDISEWPEKFRTFTIEHCGDDVNEAFKSLSAAMISLKEQKNGIIVPDQTLEAITCKTLIIAGGKDELIDISHSNHLKSKIKNSSVHVYEDGGHFFLMKYIEDLNLRIQRFILET